MDYVIYKYIHLVGLVFWMGGLFSLTSFVRYISKQDESMRESLANYAYRIYYASNFIGLLLMLGSGVLLMSVVPDLMKSGWFHTKLTVIVVLIIFDHLLMRHIKKLRKENTSNGLISNLHIIVTVLFLIALFLVVLKPF